MSNNSKEQTAPHPHPDIQTEVPRSLSMEQDADGEAKTNNDDLKGEAFIDQESMSALETEPKEPQTTVTTESETIPAPDDTVAEEAKPASTSSLVKDDMTGGKDENESTSMLENRERVYTAPSESSTAVANTDETEPTAKLPLPKRLDSASLRAQSVPNPQSGASIPAGAPTVSDMGSIGSIPSEIDNVGGLPYFGSGEQPIKVVSATPSQLASASPAPPPPQDNVLVDPPLTSQPPFLITVPPQPQQTLYYQIPQVQSVVAAHPIQPSSEQQPHPSSQQPVASTQQQVPTQPGEQVIGMVGAIPVMKLQGGGLHYVKKKKGRFSFLQETPNVPTVSAATVGTADSQMLKLTIESSLPTAQGAINAPIPANITVPTRSQSPLSGVSHFSTAPQTLDGKSAPTVKKKGRFLISNVKDPNSMQSRSGQAKATSTAARKDGQHVNVLEEQEIQTMTAAAQPMPTQQASQVYQATVVTDPTYQQAPMQQAMIQPITTMQTTYENPPQQPLHAHLSYSQPQKFSMQPTLDHQQHSFIQTIPTVRQQYYDASGQIREVVYTPQQQHMPPQQQHTAAPEYLYHNSTFAQPVPLETVSLPAHVPGPPAPSALNSSTPTPAAAISSVTVQKDSTSVRGASSASAQVPRPPSGANADKQAPKAGAAKKKSVSQARAGKLPQTIDKDGTWNTVGLGKVFYFLEQMKTEVTEADRCIKSLQTDTKHLRDKNKELEAKNRDLDRKLQEERALRERADARITELKKKLKEASEELSKAGGRTSEEDKSFDLLVESTASHTPMKSGATSPCVKLSPSGQSSGNISLQKPRSSMTRSWTDLTKKITNVSTQKDAETDDAESTPQEKQVNSSQQHTQIPEQPPTATVTPGTTKKSGFAPLLHNGIQLTAAPGKLESVDVVTGAGNLTPKGSSHDKNTEMNRSMTDASSRILDPFNSTDCDPPGTRRVIGDSSPGKATLQGSRNTSSKNSESAVASVPFPSIEHQQIPRNEAKSSLHRPSQSLHDFDPLSAHHHGGSNSDTVLPVISLPPSYSLGAVPMNGPQTTGTMSIPDINGTFMSQNPFMVPVAFEMALHAAQTNESQSAPAESGPNLMASGFPGFQQQQQFMVLPQQQSVMLQMVGTGIQPMGETNGGQWIHGPTPPLQQPASEYQQPPAQGGQQPPQQILQYEQQQQLQRQQQQHQQQQQQQQLQHQQQQLQQQQHVQQQSTQQQQLQHQQQQQQLQQHQHQQPAPLHPQQQQGQNLSQTSAPSQSQTNHNPYDPMSNGNFA